MDELDVKIFRALIAESSVAATNVQVFSSLREIAKKIGSDDMTVRNRYKKLQDAGCMHVWKLRINPTLFGHKMVNVRLEVQPESAKDDMKRKLRLVHGVVSIVDYYGKTLRVLVLYDTEESRSRTIQLISRITNAEKVTLFRSTLPVSETKRLTETDLAIMGALATDARKSYVSVAKELGFSSRTVRNRLERLRRERTIFAIPELNPGDVPGLIPAELSYSYARSDVKGSVDSAMISHFDSSFLWGGFSDPENAFLNLGLSNVASARKSVIWAKEQPGVATAQLDIVLECISLPEKADEIMSRGRTQQPSAC